MAEYTKTIVSALSSTNADYSYPHTVLEEATQAATNEFCQVRHVKLEPYSATTGNNHSYSIYSEFDGWSVCNSFILNNTGSSELSINLFLVLADLSATTMTNVDVAASAKTFTADTSADSAPFQRGNLGGDATHFNVYNATTSGHNDLYTVASITNTVLTSSEAVSGGDRSNDTAMRIQRIQRQTHFVPAGGLFVLPQIRRMTTASAAGTPEISIAALGHSSYDDGANAALGVEASFTIYMTGTNG